MGLRFQHRVTLFPGVRINFSGGGISTTLGVPGASVNIGPRGNYLNLGLPGSGLSYRTPIGGHPQRPRARHSDGGDGPALEFRPLMPGEGEIRSREVSELTSPGLEKLKELINEAARQQAEAAVKLKEAQSRLSWAEFKLGLAKAFILRLLLGRAVPGLHKAVIEKTGARDTCQAVLDAAHVNIDFAFDKETWKTWQDLSAAFDGLCRSHKIWDVTASYYADQFRERTTAVRSIVRVPVGLNTASTDIVSTKWPALRFQKTSGNHVHIYPGFAMMRDKTGDFALIDLLELSVDCSYTMFHEEEGVPGDAEVCGQTWKRANKDGGPDRRFSHNYRIPIARYGQVDMSSPTGINERYMISNYQAVAAFGSCYAAHVRALRTMTKRSQPADIALPPPEDDSALSPAGDGVVQPAPQGKPEVMAPPSLRSLAIDMVAVVAIVAGGCYYSQTQGISLASPPPPVVHDQAAGPPPKSALAPVAAPAHQMVTIKAQVANVRPSPSTSAAPVSTLPAGKVVAVFETSGDWLRIGDNEPMGWIHKSVIRN